MMKSKNLPNGVAKIVKGLFCASALIASSLVSHAQLAAKYDPTLSTIANTSGKAGYSGDGGAATAAKLSLVAGNSATYQAATATYDAAGNLYIADVNDNVIRRIDGVTGVITTVAGTGVAGYSGDGGPATSATLNQPVQVAIDIFGNLYIADSVNCAIREVSAATGNISSLLGTGPVVAPAVCAAGGSPSMTGSTIQNPYGVAVDSVGNILYSPSANNRIWRYVISTGQAKPYIGVSGGKGVYSGDGGVPLQASLNAPKNIALDAANNVYFTDTTNNAVRKLTISTNLLTLLAGTPGTAGNSGDGGPATAATLNQPAGISVDAAGNVYITCLGSNTVRVVNQATGIINTFAGTGVTGFGGENGLPTAATLSQPTGVAASAGGDRIAIVDSANNAIRLVGIRNVVPATAVGATSAPLTILAQATTAGTASSFGFANFPTDFTAGTVGCPGAVSANGFCTAAVTLAPTLPGRRNGSLVLTDSTNVNTVVGVTGVGTSPAGDFTAGILATEAGAGTAGSTGDSGPATAALLNGPTRMAVDSAKNVYIADTANNKIRKVTAATGVITTIAGTGVAGSIGDGASATLAQLNGPTGIALDSAGNIYIGDTGNNKIRMISVATGNISTYAGTGTAGSTGDNAAATLALLKAPQGVTVDSFGNLFIADTGNNKIREVYANGIIATVVGTGTAGTSADGTAATLALLNAPTGVAVVPGGTLYIAESTGARVRAVVKQLMTTVAGTGTAGFSNDGAAGNTAALSNPNQVAVDAAGNVYIADTGNSRIREVNAATGIINTIAGTATVGVSANGLLSTASNLSSPKGIALDQNGGLYIADTTNNRVAFVDTTNVSLSFGTVNHGTTTAAQTLALQNYGNQAMTLSSIAVSQASYAQVTGNATDCTATTVLAPGATCLVRVTFSPTLNGSIPGTLVITDNALNTTTSTQTITLAGTGVITPALITITGGNNQSGPPNGIYPTALAVKVVDGTGYPANGITVTFTAPATGVTGTFTNGTHTITAVTDNTGTASVVFQAGLTNGTAMVTATAAGLSATFSEIITGNIAPTLTLSVPAGTVTYGQTLTVTANLSPSNNGSANAGGTVTVLSNGVSVGVGNVSNGTATVTFSPNAGANSLTAAYSGDANFSKSSTLNPLLVTVAKLAITATTANVTLPYGTVIPAISGTITGALSSDAANLSVSFAAPSVTQKFPVVGSYTLVGTLGGSAAGNYSLTTTGNPQLIIVQAATTTTLAANPTQAYQGQSVTLTATVASTVPGGPTPTGNVAFSVGGVIFATVPLSGGMATSNYSGLPIGSDSVIATYLGNTNYLTSASTGTSVTIIGPDFAVSFDPTTNKPVIQGGRDNVTINVVINPIFGASTIISFACPNAPVTFGCSFAPTQLPAATATPYLTVVSIGTSGSALTGALRTNSNGTELAMIFLPGILLLAGASRRLRKGSRLLQLTRLGALLLAVGVANSLTGCGTGTNEQYSPVGVTNITVTATAPSLGVSHSITIPVTVTPAVN